ACTVEKLDAMLTEGGASSKTKPLPNPTEKPPPHALMHSAATKGNMRLADDTTSAIVAMCESYDCARRRRKGGEPSPLRLTSLCCDAQGLPPPCSSARAARTSSRC